MPDHSPSIPHRHGGNRQERAEALGCKPAELLDLSASLVPFGPPSWLPLALRRAIANELTPYPDRRYANLRAQIASHHGLDPDWVLPGNGAAELFTWAARDSAAFHSLLPQPGFNDYCRALDCWHGRWQALPLQLQWAAAFPQAFTNALAAPLLADQGRALWITNPHNPSGQLWCRKSLELLLPQFGLVIVDEAFLTLLPNGEQQSLVPLIDKYPNLVVVRSLGEADIQHQQVAADNLGNIQGTHHDSLEEAVVDKAAQDKANLWPCEEGEELLDAVVELGILEAVKLGDVVTELALLILVVAEMGH